jgi:hypothetical protein
MADAALSLRAPEKILELGLIHLNLYTSRPARNEKLIRAAPTHTVSPL